MLTALREWKYPSTQSGTEFWNVVDASKPEVPVLLQWSTIPPLREPAEAAARSFDRSRECLAFRLSEEDFQSNARLEQRFSDFLHKINSDPKQAQAFRKLLVGDADCLSKAIGLWRPDLLPTLQVPMSGLVAINAGIDAWNALGENDRVKIFIKGSLAGANLVDFLGGVGAIPGGSGVKLVCVVLRAIDMTYDWYCSASA